MKFCLLVNVDYHCENEVMEDISRTVNVKKLTRVYGAYDIVVEIETNGSSASEFTKIVKQIHHVRAIMTLVYSD